MPERIARAPRKIATVRDAEQVTPPPVANGTVDGLRGIDRLHHVPTIAAFREDSVKPVPPSREAPASG